MSIRNLAAANDRSNVTPQTSSQSPLEQWSLTRLQSQVSTRKITAEPISVEGFRPYGQLILPQPDTVLFNPQDAQLQLSGGIPRFYIMSLHQRGRSFHTITCHRGCTQCLGSLEGKTWFLGVAPPTQLDRPDLNEIRVFQIPGSCFVKLEVGTWHAGPYFDSETANFYNLELSDTNEVDHTTCDLAAAFGVQFEIC